MSNICPIRSNSEKQIQCLEENCALWIKAGYIETKETDNKMMRIHEPKGCCSFKAIAWRVK